MVVYTNNCLLFILSRKSPYKNVLMGIFLLLVIIRHLVITFAKPTEKAHGAKSLPNLVAQQTKTVTKACQNEFPTFLRTKLCLNGFLSLG